MDITIIRMAITILRKWFYKGLFKEASASFFSVLSHSQRQIAMISEMIHSSSLLHDDVIDQSDIRRGKPSVNVVWSQKKVR